MAAGRGGCASLGGRAAGRGEFVAETAVPGPGIAGFPARGGDAPVPAVRGAAGAGTAQRGPRHRRAERAHPTSPAAPTSPRPPGTAPGKSWMGCTGGGGGAVGTAGAGQGGAGLIPRWRPAAVQPEGAATSPTQGKEVWTVLGGCTGSGEAARRWKQGSTASDGEYSCFEWNRRRHVKTLVPVLEARSGLLQSFVIFKCVQVTKRSRLIPE